LSLSVAESCTGGLISHGITEVPGASSFFRMGVVAYSDDAKVRTLGVCESTLSRFGAVSEGVAGEMARGVAVAGGSDYGIGVTGIAGPGGGTAEKPVGTVYIGLYRSGRFAERVECFHFDGTRSEIKERASSEAIRMLIDSLSSRK